MAATYCYKKGQHGGKEQLVYPFVSGSLEHRCLF
jgi:hypothetical protein